MSSKRTALNMCIAFMLMLLSTSIDSSGYLIFGVRTVGAATREPDVTSLTTQCTSIRPRFPPENHFACYRTRTRSLGPFQTCDSTFIRQRAITQISSSENFTQFYINTPGRLRGRTYNNRLLCRWNVACEETQVLYMDMIEHNIEPVQFSSLFRRDVCVDFLKASRDFGMETSCGFRVPFTDLEPRGVRLEFRSNTRLRFPGVRMRLACFSPSQQDIEGCSPTDELAAEQLRRLRISRAVNSEQDSGFPDVLSPLQKWTTQNVTFQAKHLRYFDEVSPVLEVQRGRRVKRIATEQFTIDKTAVLYFKDNTLLVVVNGSTVKYSFLDVDTVHIFNLQLGIETFTSHPSLEQTFTGIGVLSVIQKAAYFTIYRMDLSKFEPSKSEAVMIRTLMDVEEEMLDLYENDFIIEEEDPTLTATPSDGSSVRLPPTHNRGKRQSGQFRPEVIEAARKGATSCNAVLRGVSQALLRLSEN